MKTRYVIVGNSAAGIFAAEAIRANDPSGQIILLDAEREEGRERGNENRANARREAGS